MNATERQRRVRRRRRVAEYLDWASLPASLPLSAYERADSSIVALLVNEFGEDGALRLLNGPQNNTVDPAPADPATIAPPGAVGIPRAHRTTGRAHIIEANGRC